MSCDPASFAVFRSKTILLQMQKAALQRTIYAFEFQTLKMFPIATLIDNVNLTLADKLCSKFLKILERMKKLFHHEDTQLASG